jgi:pyruvate dehydrogenase E2 component (dihydrolipoamide acetyltransferase)
MDGTFTISNLGMFGIEDFTAILNPPESGILAVAKMVDTPVALDGQVVIRPIIHFTVGADHRINDGLRVARFLNDLKSDLENPYLMF